MLASASLSQPEPAPKQTKLLGATVTGLGTVVAVSQRLTWGYALIEDQAGKTHHRFFVCLSRRFMSFPRDAQQSNTDQHMLFRNR